MIDDTSGFASRKLSLCTAAILLIFGTALWSSADEQKVSAVDQLQFQQKNAQAQMQELQERMFHLGELTKEAEPDDAARLLMAVQRAREQLIVEQMMDALNLLNTKDFSHAADEQQQVIIKLEELKRLLTTNGIDLKMLLANLKAINQAIAKLDAATKEEQRQNEAVGPLAQQQQKAAPLDNKALNGLQNDQQQNRKTTESIAQSVKGLGGQASQAGATLGKATQSMAVAEGKLGSGKPGDAQVEIVGAVQSMQEARKQLAAERDKILLQLEKMVRQQVVANLTEMLDRQQTIRAGTENVVEHMAISQRETQVKLKQLGTGETSIVRIADQTLALLEETNFSVALPPALRRVQQKCAAIAATLDNTQADGSVIASEIRVERDLQDLLDAFKELSKAKLVPGSCKGCKGDKNKLEAELKVVRMMQVRVNEDTRTVDGEHAAGEALVGAGNLPANINPMLRDKILTVRDGQTEVRDAMAKIHDQMTAPDDPAEQPAAAPQ